MEERALPSDEALVQAIATRRDERAFEALVGRYAEACYAMASHVSGDCGLAEDAVQAALLDFWRHARSYDPSLGSVRVWLLRVVANKAFNLKSRQYRYRSRRVLCKTLQQGCGMVDSIVPPASGDRLSSHSEAVLVLRGLLGRLPERDRCLVALYWGSEFTQQQIATTLRMPQTTVSKILGKTLRWLRSELEKAGLGEAAFGPGVLVEALLGGHSTPSGLLDALARIPSAEEVAPAQAQGTQLGWKTGLITVGLVAVGLAVVLAGAGFESANPGSSSGAAALPTPPAGETLLARAPEKSSAPGRSQAGPVRAPVGYHWDFNSPGVPREFQVDAGFWHWRKDGGLQGSGCMEVGREDLFMRLQAPLPRFPFLIEWKNSFAPLTHKGKVDVNHGWSRFDRAVVFDGLAKPVLAGIGEWTSWRTYVTEHSIDTWSERHGRSQAVLANKWLEGGCLTMAIGGELRIEDLRITEILPSQVPDLGSLAAALEAIDPARRAGRVLLRGLGADRSLTVPVSFEGDWGAAPSTGRSAP